MKLRQRFKLTNVLTICVVIAAVVALVALFVEQQQRITVQTQLLTAAHSENTHLLNEYTKSIRDCQRAADCTSTVPAPSTIVEQGTPGQAGHDATDSQVQRAVDIYCDLRLDCQGPQGLQGVGIPGQPGQNATDTQVADQVAAYCAAHNNCAGSPGQNGTDGSNGHDGDAGAPPASWSYTDPLGMQHDCTRTDPFDASAPTYQCN